MDLGRDLGGDHVEIGCAVGGGHGGEGSGRPDNYGRPAMALQVGFDVTSLLGAHTGIAVFTAELSHALRALDEPPGLVPYVLSRRTGAVPQDARRLAVPARVALSLWAHASWPRERRALGGVDVVHGTNYVAPPTGKPTVISVHDCSLITHPEWVHPTVRRFVPVMRRLVRAGAWVHTPSSQGAQEARSLLAASRVRVVSLGPPQPSRLPVAHPARPERPYILALATHERRKNLPRLVAAYGAAQRVHPELALVIAGAFGPDTDAVKAAITALSDDALVVLPGWVDAGARADFLSRAAALAYPSLDEGFGFPMLEAMAAGIPVIAGTAGSMPEVAGDAAVFVDPHDVDAIGSSLVRVVGDPDVRDALVDSGRARVTQFSWRRTALELMSLYRDAVADRRTST
jgi:glycosyltransferase involved in cell wall biosynthesis